MILNYSFCCVSVASIRREPSHRSEQISQLLFGEKAELLELTDKNWARIRCEWDGYEGWVISSQLAFISAKEYRKKTHFITRQHFDKIIFHNRELWLPTGSSLIGIKGKKIKLAEEEGKLKGKKQDLRKTELNQELIEEATRSFLDAPYLWGGRTIAGIDCSGLVQMVFKMADKKLPRDSQDQANEGEAVDFLQHAHGGDLAFFDNEEGKINHVGILLDEQTIIHASEANGKVAIDRIDQGGIISTSLKKRTHRLRFVKRLF